MKKKTKENENKPRIKLNHNICIYIILKYYVKKKKSEQTYVYLVKVKCEWIAYIYCQSNEEEAVTPTELEKKQRWSCFKHFCMLYVCFCLFAVQYVGETKGQDENTNGKEIIH